MSIAQLMPDALCAECGPLKISSIAVVSQDRRPTCRLAGTLKP